MLQDTAAPLLLWSPRMTKLFTLITMLVNPEVQIVRWDLWPVMSSEVRRHLALYQFWVTCIQIAWWSCIPVWYHITYMWLMGEEKHSLSPEIIPLDTGYCVPSIHRSKIRIIAIIFSIHATKHPTSSYRPLWIILVVDISAVPYKECDSLVIKSTEE